MLSLSLKRFDIFLSWSRIARKLWLIFSKVTLDAAQAKAARSVLPRLRADILPVRPSHSVNKISHMSAVTCTQNQWAILVWLTHNTFFPASRNQECWTMAVLQLFGCQCLGAGFEPVWSLEYINRTRGLLCLFNLFGTVPRTQFVRGPMWNECRVNRNRSTIRQWTRKVSDANLTPGRMDLVVFQ